MYFNFNKEKFITFIFRVMWIFIYSFTIDFNSKTIKRNLI